MVARPVLARNMRGFLSLTPRGLPSELTCMGSSKAWARLGRVVAHSSRLDDKAPGEGSRCDELFELLVGEPLLLLENERGRGQQFGARPSCRSSSPYSPPLLLTRCLFFRAAAAASERNGAKRSGVEALVRIGSGGGGGADGGGLERGDSRAALAFASCWTAWDQYCSVELGRFRKRAKEIFDT